MQELIEPEVEWMKDALGTFTLTCWIDGQTGERS
jgi:hypothetical protein